MSTTEDSCRQVTHLTFYMITLDLVSLQNRPHPIEPCRRKIDKFTEVTDLSKCIGVGSTKF